MQWGIGLNGNRWCRSGRCWPKRMKHAVGKAGPKPSRRRIWRHELVVGDRDGRRMATTRDVLKEEMRMLGFCP